MPSVTWMPHVAIAGQDGRVDKLDGDVYKKKFKLKKPSLSNLAALDRKKIEELFRYITLTLNYEMLEEVMKNKAFVQRSVTREHLQAIAGKGLISGELEEVKKMMAFCKKHPKFEDLGITDAYFDDLRNRKKRQPLEYKGLTLITAVRQGNPEIVRYILDNLEEKSAVREAKIKDGDMSFSRWADQREIADLKPKDILQEAQLSVKVFDSMFEAETPLTALMKNRQSLDKVSEDDGEKSMLMMLLTEGADPGEKSDFAAFKIAARFGLVQEIEILLRYINKNKPQLRKHLPTIYSLMLSYAATENQQAVLDLVRSRLDKSKRATAKNGPQKKNNFLESLNSAINKLTKVGLYDICTYRYRILNGLYNLLSMKTMVEAEQKNGASFIPDSEFEQQDLKANTWKRSKSSILAKNEVVDYNAAYDAIVSKKGGSLFAQRLTQNFLVGALGQIPNADSSSVGKHSNTDSFRSRGSSVSSTANARRRYFIKPQLLHSWFKNILEMNDFNGEKMGIVILALGLKAYITKGPRKKRKSGSSEAGSTMAWSVASGIESDAEMDDDGDDLFGKKPKRNNDDDAQSAISESTAGFFGNTRGRKRGRRKSTLASMRDFFKEKGAKVGEKFSKNKKISSKDKVLLLTLASEFGSEKILSQLLQLIAPEISKTLLRCVYLATLGDKIHTQKLLLDEIDKEFEKILQDEDPNYVPPESAKKPQKLGQGDRDAGLFSSARSFKYKDRAKVFLQAVEDFFEDLEAHKRQRRNKMAVAKKKANALKINGRKKKPKGRRSTIQSLKNGVKSIRKSIGGMMKTRSKRSKQPGMSVRDRLAQKHKLEMKKKITGDKKSNDPLHELKNSYIRFLGEILGNALDKGHFAIAKSTIGNKHFPPTDSRTFMAKKICTLCTSKKLKAASDRVLLGIVGLLAEYKEPNLPSVGREAIEYATSSLPDNTKALKKVLKELAKKYGKKFLTLKDVKMVLKKSTESKKESPLWPDLVKVVLHNLSKKEHDLAQSEVVKLSKKGGKYSGPVRKVLNDFASGSKQDGRNRGNNGAPRRRSSLMRIRSRISSGSFSRK